MTKKPDNFTEEMQKLFEEKYKDTIITEDDSGGVISTGILSLDASIGIGGIPRGKVTTVYGVESCLTGDTFINYTVRNSNNKAQNSKGGTIKRLYERFNHINMPGKGNYQRKQTINSVFAVPSINEHDCIFQNTVADVVYSGKKDVFEVETIDGQKIKTTREHKFYVGNNIYKPLSELKGGDEIFIHDNFANKKEHKKYIRKYICVKYHSNGNKKVISGCLYYRIRDCILAYEANKNNFSYEEYRDILNTKDSSYIDNLWHIPFGYDIHHKDFNHTNNSLDNLEILLKSDHYRLHSKLNIDNFSFIARPRKIKSIKPCGVDDTYDVKCYSPYNNYVANKFVVHNSGKSTLALNICKHVVQSGGKALYLDLESQLSFDRMCELVGIENVGNSFILAKPQSAENAFEIAEAGINHNEFNIIVFDTIAALSPKAELEAEFTDGSFAQTPRLLNKFFRRNGWSIRKNKIAILFLNQVRDSVGSYIKFYTYPGGHALRHYSSVIIYLTKKAEIKQNKESVGIVTEFTIKKNKVAAPFRSYKFPIMFDSTGIDEYRDIVDFSEMLGIVRRGGAYYKFNDVVLGSGFVKTMEFLKENQDILEQIKESVYSIVNKSKILIENEEESEIEDSE